MQHRTELWTLDELTQRVGRALASDYVGQSSGRVRDVPDRRTIRYYTTLGLIDRPAAMRGRAALYGRRHLLQLVSIKRLQAGGCSLEEVQARLVGLTDAKLRELARLPAGFDDASSPAPAPNGLDRRHDRFWSEPPTDAAHASTLTGVPLADGATLLVQSARPLDADDLAALRTAAAPLISILTARRVIDVSRTKPLSQGESP
jgi:hypothetical protein